MGPLGMFFAFRISCLRFFCRPVGRLSLGLCASETRKGKVNRKKEAVACPVLPRLDGVCVGSLGASRAAVPDAAQRDWRRSERL